MKMATDHYRELRKLVQTAIDANGIPVGVWFDRYKANGFSEKRCRWDFLWSIPREDRQDWFEHCGIYGYLDDTHIDTALRNILAH